MGRLLILAALVCSLILPGSQELTNTTTDYLSTSPTKNATNVQQSTTAYYPELLFTSTSSESTTNCSNMTWDNTTETETEEAEPLWLIVMDILPAISLVGFLLNFLTLATLLRDNVGLSVGACLLLRHQSTLDGIVSLLAFCLSFPPPMWTTGVLGLDIFICHLWHSQAFYWQWYTASVYNLVLIAIDRFICVRKPLQHQSLMSKRNLLKGIAGIHSFAFALLIPSYIQANWIDGRCQSRYDNWGPGFVSFMAVYGIMIFVFFYSIPLILFILCYGYVAVTLRRRGKGDSVLPESRVIKQASQQLTKSAITVTVIFILSTSLELWYYLLGRTFVVPYCKNCVVQKLAVILSILNVAANPLVYALMMPVYRRAVIQTITCKNRKKASSKYESNSSTGVTSVSNTGTAQ